MSDSSFYDLVAARIEAELGVAVECHKAIDSTNTRGLAIAANDVELPQLVLTEKQTAGRGRGGNSWWSADGSLTFTLVVSRGESGTELPPYSLAVGLAIRETLAAFVSARLQVKWPNDVMLGDRKVAGILIEIPPTRSDVLIIGIGINANNSFASAPPEISSLGVSLADQIGSPVDCSAVLIELVRYVLKAVGALAEESAANLVERWKEHCFLSGRDVTIDQGNRTLNGVCHGIAATGALLVGDEAVASGVVVRF